MHNAPLQSIQFHPTLNEHGMGQLCVSSADGFLYVWHFKLESVSRKRDEREVTITFTTPTKKFLCRTATKHDIRCWTFTQSGFRIIVGSTDGFVRMIRTDYEGNITTNRNLTVGPPDFNLFDHHEGHVTSMHCSYRNGRFVTGSWDGTARIWSFDRTTLQWTSACLEVYKDGPKYQANPQEDKRNKVLSVLWSFDDTKVITSSDDNVIRVWNAFTGELLFRLVFHTEHVYIMAAHPKIDALVMSAGWDGKIALWNITNGALVNSFVHHGSKFNDGQFNNDGSLFALVDNLGALLIFSMAGSFDSYILASPQQFFPIDFNGITFDSNNNPLDTVTLLPAHLNARIGSKSRNGVPNPIVPFNYGIDLATEQTEVEIGDERCDIESIRQEECKIYELEKSSKLLPGPIDIENRIKKRKKLKFDIEEQQMGEEVIPDEAQTIRDYVNAYDSASDESFRESRHVSRPSEENGEHEEEESYTDSDAESDHYNQYSSSETSEFSETDEQVPRRRGRVAQREDRARTQRQVLEYNAPLLPNEYPADWTRQVSPTIIPYVPQLGDEVCYFRQGHQQFLELIPHPPEVLTNALPWEIFPAMGHMVEGMVTGIWYIVGPPTTIKLEVTMLTRRRQTTNVPKFNIVYYDHPDMTDFVILRRRYEESQGKLNLRINTRVKVIFAGDELYEATILKNEPFDQGFPESPWQQYTVHWEDESNDEDSRCSPWEILKRNESLRATPGSFVVEPEHEAFLSELMQQYDIFREPVNLHEYPVYARIIAYPICLETVNDRLQRGYYRTLEQFQFECKMVATNAKAFNQPGSGVYRLASEILGRIEDFFSASHEPEGENISEDSEESDVQSRGRRKRMRRSAGVIHSDDD